MGTGGGGPATVHPEAPPDGSAGEGADASSTERLLRAAKPTAISWSAVPTLAPTLPHSASSGSLRDADGTADAEKPTKPKGMNVHHAPPPLPAPPASTPRARQHANLRRKSVLTAIESEDNSLAELGYAGVREQRVGRRASVASEVSAPDRLSYAVGTYKPPSADAAALSPVDKWVQLTEEQEQIAIREDFNDDDGAPSPEAILAGTGVGASTAKRRSSIVRPPPPPALPPAEAPSSPLVLQVITALLLGSSLPRDAKRTPPGLLDAWGLFTEYGLVDPNLDFMRRWDNIAMLLLGWTAIVTPYEVAFLNVSLNWLFLFNRLVEFFFLLDLFLNFMLPVTLPGDGVQLFSRGAIAAQYLKFWFWIDLVSILPFDTIDVALGDAALDDRLSAVRVLKVLRLVKISRLLRVGRISSRKDNGNDAVDYTKLQLMQFLTITIMAAHWIACGFKLVSVLEVSCPLDSPNYAPSYDPTDMLAEPPFEGAVGCSGWLGERARSEGRLHMIDRYVDLNIYDILVQYLDALYFSVMTISTIGYGDLTPTTPAETMYATVAMLLGGFMFGYVIGAVGNVISTREARKNQYYRQMEDLNEFITTNKLDEQLAVQLRLYFGYRGRMMSVSSYNSLLMQMSPALRGRVLMSTNKLWIKKVPLFQEAPLEFVVQVALVLSKQTYPPQEAIIKPGHVAEQVYIINRGVVAGNGRLLTIGQIIGEEALLRYEAGRRSYTMKAVTFVECSALHREDLIAIFNHFPEMNTKWRRYTLHMVFRAEVMAYCDAVRLLSRELEEKKAAKEGKTVAKRRMSIGMMLGTGVAQRTLHYMNKLRDFIVVDPDEGERLRNAATKLQSVFRGHKSRKAQMQMKLRSVMAFTRMRKGKTTVAPANKALIPASQGATPTRPTMSVGRPASLNDEDGEPDEDELAEAQRATILEAVSTLGEQIQGLVDRVQKLEANTMESHRKSQSMLESMSVAAAGGTGVLPGLAAPPDAPSRPSHTDAARAISSAPSASPAPAFAA